MISIRDLVGQALATGYLTIAAEEQLRSLLRTKYTSEDMKAFMQLQLAAMNGCVKQESREAYLGVGCFYTLSTSSRESLAFSGRAAADSDAIANNEAVAKSSH